MGAWSKYKKSRRSPAKLMRSYKKTLAGYMRADMYRRALESVVLPQSAWMNRQGL